MILSMLAAAAGAAPMASAAATAPIEITSRVLVEHRLTQPDGTVRIQQVPAERAVPGDRVSVVIAYRNTGRAVLAGVAISNPVPRGLVFGGTASPGFEVSVDGARFAPLAALSVPVASGGTRPARADDVAALRWRLPTLAPGAAGQFSFSASIR